MITKGGTAEEKENMAVIMLEGCFMFSGSSLFFDEPLMDGIRASSSQQAALVFSCYSHRLASDNERKLLNR